MLDRDLIENIIKDDLLNTWIDILSQYANKWINGEEIPIPKSFQEATEEVIETNDHIQDFIDVKLTITNGGKADRIGKNEMIDIYKEMYPNRGINHQILKSHLGERKIDWDKEIRGSDGIKGCYINVIRRKNEDIDDHNECMFIDKTDKAEYIRAEDHKIVLDKLKKVEGTNKNITDDLNDAMKYIAQLEKYVMESNEDVDEDMEVVEVVDEVDEVVDEDIDFIEIGRNVFVNKKNNQTYEVADDDDLNEDLF